MGKPFRPHTLYEDEFYVIIQDEDRKNITLVMPIRRLALEFAYDEWQDLRSIVKSIDIPDVIGDERVSLYDDGIHIFMTSEHVVEWGLNKRMVIVIWLHDEWVRFKAMMAAVEHVPWTVI